MELRTTYRALLLAETMRNVAREAEGKEPEPFRIETERDKAYYYYATIDACNPGLMTFDEFLDKMDDPGFKNEIEQWINREAKERSMTESKKKGRASR